MQKLRPVLFFLFISLSLLASDKKELHIVNWSWYVEIDDDLDEDLPILKRSPLLQEFMKKHDCLIKYSEFDSEVDLLNFIKDQGRSVDVFNLSQDYLLGMKKKGLLHKFTNTKLSDEKNWSPFIRSMILPELLGYAALYHAGTMGILYRKDIMKDKAIRLKDLLDPKGDLKVGILNSSEMVDYSLKSLGYSFNSTNEKELRQAKEQLVALFKNPRLRFVSSDLDAMSKALLDGKIHMGIMYSSDGLSHVVADKTGKLDFVIPEEGSEKFLDCWGINTNTKNPELAEAFVSFTLTREIQERNALYLNAIPTQKEADETVRKIWQKQGNPGNVFLNNLRKYELILHENYEENDRFWERLIKSLK